MRIAVNIPLTFPNVWKIAAGALEFELSAEDVVILLPKAGLASDHDKNPQHWDGVIVRRPKPDLDIAQVVLSPAPSEECVGITVSEHEISRLVVDKFASMGLKSTAFFGRTDMATSQLRWKGFSEQCKRRDIDPVFISSNGDNPREALLKIRKPCGIMAPNDRFAFRLMRLCKEVGLDVPRDVNVISVGDTAACLESSPTLSSISMPYASIGFHAAKLCAQMIKGECANSVQLSPSGLMVRDSLNVTNEDIRTAAEVAFYLRENLSNPIQMADIARRSNLTRRRLEQIFRDAYGVSPIAYLRNLRFEHAKTMLETTDVPLKEIVDACVFTDTIHLCHVFKKATGMSPLTYRRSSRSDSGSN